MKFPLAILALSAVFATPALAHHSGAMFDRDKLITLTGTIKEYEFAQPHTWIRIMSPAPGGGEEEWAIEGNAPQNMRTRGFVPSALRAGQKVTLRAHPLRDGRKGGSIVDMTFADGRILTTVPERAVVKP